MLFPVVSAALPTQSLPANTDFLAVRAVTDMPGAHPAALEFWRYAQTCRVVGGLPSRTIFDPTEIGALLARIWIIDVLRDPIDFRYRLAGTHIVETVGFEPTGKLFSDILAERIAVDPAFLARFRFMADSGVSTWRLGPARNWKNMDYKTVENLCVPFAVGEDPTRVAQIMSISIFYRADGTVF
jgi:hypothetical protein